MLKITQQEKYETLHSVVSRALATIHAGATRIRLEATVDDVRVWVEFEVPRGAKPTVEELTEALRQEAERVKNEDIDVQSGEAGQNGYVPTDGEHVPWSQLHPVLREVVLATLRKAREDHALGVAEGNAQQIALMSSMSDLMSATGERGQVMAASMSQGMAQTIEGALAGKRAVYAAYNVAIAELEKLQ